MAVFNTSIAQHGIKELDFLIGNYSPDSAFHILPTIPQTFPHFRIPHFTFRIPQFRILPMTGPVRSGFVRCGTVNSHTL